MRPAGHGHCCQGREGQGLAKSESRGQDIVIQRVAGEKGQVLKGVAEWTEAGVLVDNGDGC